MTERSEPVALPSKPSNAVLAGNAFVARFKREPVSPSDAAWLNGYVIAFEGNAPETTQPVSKTSNPGGFLMLFWDKIVGALRETPSPRHDIKLYRADEVDAYLNARAASETPQPASKEYPRLMSATLEWYSQSSNADISSMASELLDRRAHAPETPASPDEGFQARVHDWMAKCFARPDAMLPAQRSFRFIEEALELVQASGTSREDVLRLVEYVYGRPPGVIGQEIGGVMVTLSGLATSFGLSMEYAGNAELVRCEENTENIRAKDLAKPQRSSLLGAAQETFQQPSDPNAEVVRLLTLFHEVTDLQLLQHAETCGKSAYPAEIRLKQPAAPDKRFEAYVAHVVGEAAQWKTGSGTHPPALEKAIAELCEYYYRGQFSPATGRPAAWIKGFREPNTVNGPGEYFEECYPGDEPPATTGWTALYTSPAPKICRYTQADDNLLYLTDCGREFWREGTKELYDFCPFCGGTVEDMARERPDLPQKGKP